MISVKSKRIIFSIILILMIILSFEAITRIGQYTYYNVFPKWHNEELNDQDTRLLFIGDSMTNGVGAPKGQSYPEQLKEMILKTNKQIEIYNKALPGANTKNMANTANSHIDQYQPHMIFIMAGTNDHLTHPEYKPSLIYKSKTWRLIYSLQNVIDPKKILVRMIPTIPDYEGTERNLNQIIQYAQKQNPETEIFILGYVTYEPGYFRNQILKKIAENNNVNYFSGEPFITLKDNKTLFCADNAHPNEKGYKIIAERLFKELTEKTSS